MIEPSCDPALAEAPEKAVTVLTLIAHDEDHSILAGVLNRSNWRVFNARNCRQACELIDSQRIPVIICDATLADGSWKEMLARCGAADDAPLLIVTSRHADEYLWAEVLNLGGYDVLAKPFEAEEVVRVVSLAWLHWKNKVRGFHTLKATA